jgi:hypothetical protein
MIVKLKPNPNEEQLQSLRDWLLGKGIRFTRASARAT